MDHNLFQILQPIAILGTLGLVPICIVSVVSYFKHKTRQLEVMRELRGKELTNEQLALEARLKQLEITVQQLAGQSPLLAPPPSLTEAQVEPGRKERA